jgi:hypothetical protein
MNEYRIRVKRCDFTKTHVYSSYMPQIKRWWWPFWCDLSHWDKKSEEEARRTIKNHRGEITDSSITYIGPPV